MVALGLVSSCGGGETEPQRATEAVESLQGDMAAGRLEAVCAAMTERVHRQIGSIGHGRRPTTCERDLRDLVEGTHAAAGAGDGESLRRAPRPEVVDVAVGRAGDAAVATLTLGGDPFRVPLAKEDGEWKLDDLLGATGPIPRALE